MEIRYQRENMKHFEQRICSYVHVRFGDIVTDFFDVEESVKQGCVLSPILFCLYINKLSKMIDEHELGIHILGVNIKCLGGADDVV